MPLIFTAGNVGTASLFPVNHWLVPRLTLAAEAQMEHHCKVLEQEGAANIEQTVRIATSLTRQNALQQALLRQALGYILQLEAELALRDRDAIAAE